MLGSVSVVLALVALQTPTIASLRITPSQPVIVAHDTLRVRAEALDASGAVIASARIRFVAAGFANALIANLQGAWRVRDRVALSLGVRHVGRSFLANDGNQALTTPAYALFDGGGSVTVGRYAIRVQAQNLFNGRAYASGYTDGVTRYYFPIASRTVIASLVLTPCSHRPGRHPSTSACRSSSSATDSPTNSVRT